MILNITLSVVVVVFGFGFFFIFYKYKSATKTKTNYPLPESNHIIEMNDRFYDIINDAEMLDDQQLQQLQMQINSDYLDVIQGVNSTGSTKSKKKTEQRFP